MKSVLALTLALTTVNCYPTGNPYGEIKIQKLEETKIHQTSRFDSKE